MSCRDLLLGPIELANPRLVFAHLRRRLGHILLLCVLLAGPLASLGAGQTHDHAAMQMPGAPDGEFNPYIVADSRGGFYFSFVERQNGLSSVMLEHSLPDGTFSAPVQVNPLASDGAVRNENPPKIAVGRNNEVYVLWASERERWKGNIRFARSLDRGRTFEPAIDLNSGVAEQPIARAFESIAVDAKGRIFVVWIDERNKTAADRGAQIWMAVSTDHGKTFSRDRKIVENVCECCRTTIAFDSAGRIYVSYRAVPPTGPMLRDIAVARSDDDGKTFRSFLVNHDGWELNACPIDGATMTIDASDRIEVVWFTQSGGNPRLYWASSTNQAASFTKPVLFDPAQKLAKHADVVSVSGNRVLIAWDDLNISSMVKWGLFDLSGRPVNLLGTQPQSSYPIVAMSDDNVAVVAQDSDRSQVFRTIQSKISR